MSDTPTVDDMMAAYALDAVDHAGASFKTQLDFSPQSVENVEAILAQLHAAIPRGVWKLFRRAPPEETIDTICKMYGGYVGEVFRRERGGTWEFDQEILPGYLIIALRKGESKIFPPSKVRKRLQNGPEDNVWFYFQVLMSEPWDEPAV